MAREGKFTAFMRVSCSKLMLRLHRDPISRQRTCSCRSSWAISDARSTGVKTIVSRCVPLNLGTVCGTGLMCRSSSTRYETFWSALKIRCVYIPVLQPVRETVGREDLYRYTYAPLLGPRTYFVIRLQRTFKALYDWDSKTFTCGKDGE